MTPVVVYWADIVWAAITLTMAFSELAVAIVRSRREGGVNPA